ncbi:hypothetical protein N7527_007390 [Penicillium freii]|nr:hypothetical protein N7527_007390 [Penicillium freii]
MSTRAGPAQAQSSHTTNEYDTFKELASHDPRHHDNSGLQANDRDCTLESNDRDCTLELNQRTQDTHKVAIDTIGDDTRQPVKDVEASTERKLRRKLRSPFVKDGRIRPWRVTCIVAWVVVVIVIIVVTVPATVSGRH